MPAMVKCPICGFDGPHGFTEAGPYMMAYYHRDHGNGYACTWYEGLGRKYKTRNAAWRAVMKADPWFDKLWYYYVSHYGNRRLKLVRLYRKRLAGTLTQAEMSYLRDKGYSDVDYRNHPASRRR